MASFAVVPREAATDTETQSDVSPTPSASAGGHSHRRAIAGLASASALLAVGAVAATSHARATSAWLSHAGAVSQWATFNSTGCADWKTSMINSMLTFDTRWKCEKECEKTPGCKYANYQPGQCRDGDEGAHPRGCYLFADCAMEENKCWDLTESSGPELWSKNDNKGCANWDTIKLGPALEGKTLYSCGYECLGNPDCHAFNFQHYDCHGTEQIREGACYLFTANVDNGCHEEHNECWDLYYIKSSTTATTTTTTTTTTTSTTLCTFADGKCSQGGATGAGADHLKMCTRMCDLRAAADVNAGTCEADLADCGGALVDP